MNRYSLLLLSLALAGCAMNTQVRPTSVIEQRVLVWTAAVSERYDFAALSSFVNETIRENYDWQGLDVSRRYAKQWGFRTNACLLVGENWIFGAPDPKKNEFTLVTSFPQPDAKSKDVTLHCIRRARDAFYVDSIEIEEHELDLAALKKPRPAAKPKPSR
jgi:hypothetical protein